MGIAINPPGEDHVDLYLVLPIWAFGSHWGRAQAIKNFDASRLLRAQGKHGGAKEDDPHHTHDVEPLDKSTFELLRQ